MSSATILRADRTHVVQIMEVWKQFMEYHQRIDPYYGTVEDGHLQFGEYIIGRMGQEESLVLVAMEGDRLLGYCLCYLHHRPPVFTERVIGVLSDLAVREGERGAGTGGELVESALQWFRGNGIKRVELRTSARNGLSIEFYRRHGFRVYDHMMTRDI